VSFCFVIDGSMRNPRAIMNPGPCAIVLLTYCGPGAFPYSISLRRN
jgi:hypothetical protein